jgi:hypothetical protein
MRAHAQGLVGLQPDIIVTASTPPAVALQRETRTIPIVFVGVSDPVGSGIVLRLDRPGGNITGFVNLEATLGGKWLDSAQSGRGCSWMWTALRPVSPQPPRLAESQKKLHRVKPAGVKRD